MNLVNREKVERVIYDLNFGNYREERNQQARAIKKGEWSHISKPNKFGEGRFCAENPRCAAESELGMLLDILFTIIPDMDEADRLLVGQWDISLIKVFVRDLTITEKANLLKEVLARFADDPYEQRTYLFLVRWFWNPVETKLEEVLREIEYYEREIKRDQSFLNRIFRFLMGQKTLPTRES